MSSTQNVSNRTITQDQIDPMINLTPDENFTLELLESPIINEAPQVTSLNTLPVVGLEKYPEISKILSGVEIPKNKLSFDPSSTSNAPLPAKGDVEGVKQEIIAAMTDLGLDPQGKDKQLVTFFLAAAGAESSYNMSHIGDTSRGKDRASQGLLQFALLVQNEGGPLYAITDKNGKTIPIDQLRADGEPQGARNALRASIAHMLNLGNRPYSNSNAQPSAYNMLASYQSGSVEKPNAYFEHYMDNINQYLGTLKNTTSIAENPPLQQPVDRIQ